MTGAWLVSTVYESFRNSANASSHERLLGRRALFHCGGPRLRHYDSSQKDGIGTRSFGGGDRDSHVAHQPRDRRCTSRSRRTTWSPFLRSILAGPTGTASRDQSGTSPNHPNGQRKSRKPIRKKVRGDSVAEQGGAACATDQTTGESGDQVDHPPTGVDPVPKVIAESKQVSLENLPDVTVRTFADPAPVSAPHVETEMQTQLDVLPRTSCPPSAPGTASISPAVVVRKRRPSVCSPTQCDWLELRFAESKL